jgi:hypothetical protein
MLKKRRLVESLIGSKRKGEKIMAVETYKITQKMRGKGNKGKTKEVDAKKVSSLQDFLSLFANDAAKVVAWLNDSLRRESLRTSVDKLDAKIRKVAEQINKTRIKFGKAPLSDDESLKRARAQFE